MAKYQVREGARLGVAELTWPAVVELTEAEAAGLLDLVELCADGDGEQPGGLAEEESRGVEEEQKGREGETAGSGGDGEGAGGVGKGGVRRVKRG